jgi:hypothetical protein
MARVRVTQWRAERIIAKVPRILNEYGPLIGFQLQQEISKDQYDWPVDTRRKSGRLVKAGKRDIVDTGELLNSQTPAEVEGGTLTIRWGAPYSLEVLEGGYLVGTLRNYYVAPGRDWITPALREKPLLPFLVERWQQLASGQR